MRISSHPILSFEAKKVVSFTFEGRPMSGLEGEPIAAALHDNGVLVLRHSIKKHRPRGFFCAIGRCSSCLMVVDGVPNIRTCVEPLREGMVVLRQSGKGTI